MCLLGAYTVFIFYLLSLGFFSDLFTVTDHVPSPEPLKYKKTGGEWYNQDDMVIKDGPQGKACSKCDIHMHHLLSLILNMYNFML